ncbi:MAG: transcription elongation factor GreA [Microthrixaceae bacterium]|jgi:transcription elongation factor GreA|nr:transcription elongation factor GreA [Microthrixaceae bacterium]
MADTVHLSQAAFDRLKEEHDDLVTRGRLEIARKIEAARELGDLSENGDYHAAKEEQGKMEGRIIHLAKLIENAEIVQTGALESVQTGVVVGLRYEGDEGVEHYLLGSIEERVDGVDVMSPGSPLGAALIGHAVGDIVSYETPSGAVLSVEVAEIVSVDEFVREQRTG